jgi:hypothetical protein
MTYYSKQHSRREIELCDGGCHRARKQIASQGAAHSVRYSKSSHHIACLLTRRLRGLPLCSLKAVCSVSFTAQKIQKRESLLLKVSFLLWNVYICYCTDKNPPLTKIMNQINPFYNFKFCFLEPNLVFLNLFVVNFLQVFRPTKFLRTPRPCHVCQILHIFFTLILYDKHYLVKSFSRHSPRLLDYLTS